MSMITRCPECLTMFRVVPDQLRISDGWVRCGQCEAEFDANTQMQDASALAQSAAQQLTPNEPIEPDPATPLTAAVSPMADVAVSPPPPTAPPDSESADAMAVLALAQQPEASAQPPALPQEPSWEPSPSTQAVTSPAAPPAPPRAEGQRTFTQAAIDIPVPPGLSFVREPAQLPLWHRTWMRATLGMLALLLGIALTLQVIVQERDRLAAHSSAINPLLQTLCEVFACQVRPLRQIESIVIESSSFNKIRGDVYRLNLTIKNTSNVELAMPSIELALTDTTDQPLMRRVFLSKEFGSPAPVIAANSESVSTLALSIKANPATERISGYRVLAFYP
jgi:predicted Zn finger-like uncharacterized protein